MDTNTYKAREALYLMSELLKDQKMDLSASLRKDDEMLKILMQNAYQSVFEERERTGCDVFD